MGTNSLRFRCMAYSPMLLRQDLQQADHGGITHRDGLGRTQLATPHQTTHYCAVRWEKRKQVLERPSRRRTARLAVGVLIQSKGANHVCDFCLRLYS